MCDVASRPQRGDYDDHDRLRVAHVRRRVAFPNAPGSGCSLRLADASNPRTRLPRSPGNTRAHSADEAEKELEEEEAKLYGKRYGKIN